MDKLLKKYKGVIMAIVGYMSGIFLFSLLAYYMNLTDNVLSIASFVMAVIFTLLSSVITAVHSDKKGWLNGLLGGSLFTVFIVIISFWAGGGIIDSGKLFIRLPLYILISLIGGIMGINMK